ncbi:MAG TPA: DNA-3-methyladenine glycosylase [Chloroflexota bacterium]|nr:DNA-3-methyladenine glycosylase [Chloroflexota bacterium]
MKLRRSFFARPSPEVARDLLGKVLARRTGDALLRGRIVETEAYTGASDPGSHAFRGPTPRNQVMFGEAGHLYVYFTYGMHHCVNVVTDQPGTAGAVLLRALEPLEGIEVMEANRSGRPLRDLCNGPGKLCQSFGITRDQNGDDLEGSDIWIEDDGFRANAVATSTRVGLSAGADLPFRFFVQGNPFVSRGERPGGPGVRRQREKA